MGLKSEAEGLIEEMIVRQALVQVHHVLINLGNPGFI